MTAGVQNGTDIYVMMDPAGGTSYTQIGGQNSHTLTLNNNLIDITNKSSAQFREILEGQGTQSLDLSLELTFNSEATFVALRAMAGAKTAATFRVTVPTGNIDMRAMVASFVDTSPDGDKFSAAVSLQSTLSFTWI